MNRALLLTTASAFALVLAASMPATAADGARASSESTSEGNTAIDNGSSRDNDTESSWNGGATGIVHDQQNNGANNGIGAATAVHADVTGGTALDTSAEAKSRSRDNESDHEGAQQEGDDRDNEIDDTMNEFVGSATLQQNNGDNNAINAATALDGVDGDADGVTQDATAKAGTSDHGGDWKEDLALDDETIRDNDVMGDAGPSSFNGAAGVFTVQQNNGNGNGMSAATAALGVTGNAGGLEQDAKATARAEDNGSIGFDAERENSIQSSFNEGFAGVATVQQNNGDGNGISAATAVAGVGGNADGITQHAIAGGIGAGTRDNESVDHFSNRNNSVDGSFVGAHGVLTVQQNNGDNNAINAATAVAAAAGSAGDIHQGTGAALLFSGAAGNRAADIDSIRRNLITEGGPFNGASGIMTVQQNNGDANGINAATSVIGIAGDAGAIDQHAMNGLFLTGSGWNKTKDKGSERDNQIKESFREMSGIATVQQNNGNANSISAGTGVIAVGGTSGDVDQTIRAGNDEYTGSTFNKTRDKGSDRDNLIDRNAFRKMEGIATIQQNNGDANSMTAMTMATMNAGGGSALDQDIKTGGLVLGNRSKDKFSDRQNVFSGNSVKESKGIATVQQNNGDGNAISSATGVLFNIGDGKLDDVKQRVIVLGRVEDNRSKHKVNRDQSNGKRSNLMDNESFEDNNGIYTAQQNNGNNNAMGVGIGVRAETNSSETSSPDEDDVSRQVVRTKGVVKNNRSKSKDLGFDDASRVNTVIGNMHSSNGVYTVQQNNGDNNAIGAAVAVAADINTADDLDSAIDNDSEVIGRVKNNRAKDTQTTHRNQVGGNGTVGSRLKGIATVQQNNGSNNVMGSAVGVVANINTGFRFGNEVSADATADKTKVENNHSKVNKVTRSNNVNRSFIGAGGVMTVQQSNGDNNVIGSAVNVVAGTELPGFGPAASTATLGATVSGNTAKVDTKSGPSSLTNGLTEVFTGAAGVMVAQQNNGANNGMGSAITTVANGFTFSFNN